MIKRVLYALVLLSLTTANPTFGQQPATSQPVTEDVNEIVRRAGIGIIEYRTRFKDLTAEEEQKVQEYDSQGKVEKQRQIASDLFIYQSQLDPTQMVEYRDVKSVDGVAVKKREARLVEILNKSTKADSVKKELERVNRESTRYDLGFSFYGLTLYQGLLLDEKARDAFQFTITGREQLNGHDVIVIAYQQVSQSPHVQFNLALPAPLRGSEALYRGRLWLDADTAQIRREVREMTLRPPSLDHPLVLMRFEFDYADSRFGFLTPKRIVITNYGRGRTVNNKPEVLLGGKVTFDYGAFTRFVVEAPNATVDPLVKP